MILLQVRLATKKSRCYIISVAKTILVLTINTEAVANLRFSRNYISAAHLTFKLRPFI